MCLPLLQRLAHMFLESLQSFRVFLWVIKEIMSLILDFFIAGSDINYDAALSADPIRGSMRAIEKGLNLNAIVFRNKSDMRAVLSREGKVALLSCCEELINIKLYAKS